VVLGSCFQRVKHSLLVRVQSITELLQALAKFCANRLLWNMQKQLQLQLQLELELELELDLQGRIQGSLHYATHDTVVSSSVEMTFLLVCWISICWVAGCKYNSNSNLVLLGYS
jgi:hypothetical protein